MNFASKNNSFAFIRDDMVAVVTDDEALLNSKVGGGGVFFIDRKAFLIVQEYVAANKAYLDRLMVRNGATTPYWEENHHDRITNEIVAMFKGDDRKISNALWAAGY